MKSKYRRRQFISPWKYCVWYSNHITIRIMYTTLIILFITALMFAIGKIRSDIVALCALLALLLTHNLTTAEALSGFSNSVVIMMAGLFIVGGGVLQTGLASMIGAKITRLAGNNENRLFVLVVVVTALIGAFVSNTGTVALMLPIVVSMASGSGFNSRRLLMPLAFASSMGGMLTLIGTPPNLVIQEALIDAGQTPLSFFSFFPIGIISILVGLVVLLPLSKWVLKEKKHDDATEYSKGKSPYQLAEEYHLNDNLFVYKVDAASTLIGQTIGSLNIYAQYGLNIIEVRNESGRKSIIRNVTQRLASANTILNVNDILFVNGDKKQAECFCSDFQLKATKIEKDDEGKRRELDFYDLGVAELVLMPECRLVGRPLKECGFRERYNVNIMGIRRNSNHVHENISDIHLKANDVLLVQGTWKDIARLGSDADEWVLLGQPMEEASKVTLNYKAPLAAAIMLMMILLMVFDFIPVAPVTAVLLAAVLMILSGCFRSVEAAYKTINWESIVLIAAMMPMSVALTNTGASALISQSLVSSLGNYGPYALLGGIYLTTSILTMFISNTATAVLMAPIAISAASSAGISPCAMLLAVSVAASMCFASPFSTPPNALVMQAGRYTFMDYIKVGLPLQVIMGCVMTFALPLLFPFH